jgi:DNA-binding NarL/FixJ family response regulator
LQEYCQLHPSSYEEFIDQLLDGWSTKALLPSLATVTLQSNLTEFPLEKLTERELEILQMVAEGASNLEIAEKLVLSHGTVKAHVFNLRGKLGARNRTEAVVLAGLIGSRKP